MQRVGLTPIQYMYIEIFKKLQLLNVKKYLYIILISYLIADRIHYYSIMSLFVYLCNLRYSIW